jgi:hypothetical protein
MKIYTKVVIDMSSGAILEEESHDYSGPVALCGGGGTTVAAPTKTDTELETEKINMEYMQLMLDRAKNPEAYQTDLEKLMNQYGETALTDYIENMPEQKAYNEKMMEYTTQLIDYNTQQLQNIKTIQDLSEYTGELTSEEKSMLDTVAQNAISKITSTVNEQNVDIINDKIARLVDSGSLNSTVGTQLLSKVNESAQKVIAQGATDVETARLQQEISLMQGNKDRALALANYGLNQQQIFSGIGAQTSTALSQPIMTASQIAQYGAGLQNQWSNTAGQSINSMMNYNAQGYSTRYNAAIQQAIADSQASAAKSQSIWGGVGAVAAVAAIAI